MKKPIFSILKSNRRESIIHCRETDCEASIEELFERIYPSLAENSELYHPLVKLRYMVDDYWELILQNHMN